MTCQVGLIAGDTGVLLSDSQLSTRDRAWYGAQKQLVGDGFLLGGAGLYGAIEGLFAHLLAKDDVNAASIEGEVMAWIGTALTQAGRGELELVLVRQDADAAVLRQLGPYFADWKPCTNLASIGSGSAFVDSALTRDQQLGCAPLLRGLDDCIVAGFDYHSTSRASLTVDSRYMLGILSGGKSYLFRDRDVVVPGPSVVASGKNADFFSAIQAASLALSAQYQASTASFRGALQHKNWPRFGQELESAVAGQAELEMGLRSTLADAMAWYDLARTAPAT